MNTPSVEMLSRIVAQLTEGQRLQVLQQCGLQRASNSLCADRDDEQTMPAEDEVMFKVDKSEAEEFTMEQLTNKRTRNAKATAAQQTFAVGIQLISIFTAATQILYVKIRSRRFKIWARKC